MHSRLFYTVVPGHPPGKVVPSHTNTSLVPGRISLTGTPNSLRFLAFIDLSNYCFSFMAHTSDNKYAVLTCEKRKEVLAMLEQPGSSLRKVVEHFGVDKISINKI